MTLERMRLLRKVREQPLSVTALAAALERDRKSVHRDVGVLHTARLVSLKKQPNPGHGVVQVVSVRGKRIELRAEL